MDIKDSCFNCQATRKELEESKQKHMLDFRTIKEKIVSTDKLIKLYQEKCQEFDKQTKHVAELATKLGGSQRNIDVIRLQLKKSLELSEPLQKTCNELQKENQVKRNEMQKLQDKLRGSENLVTQLKNAVKEKEKSADAFQLDMTIQEREIDGQKKRLKKNETLMTKLKEQVSEQKREKREVNKQLTLAQNRLKKMENQDEASKEMIAKLTDQLRQAKQASNGFDKVHKFIKSPSPPKRLRRTRSSCALEQQKDANELMETHLIDEINYLLSLSPCPSLSPLPPSPCPSRKDDDDIGSENAKLVNDDLDCIDGGDDGDSGGDGVGDGVGVGDGDDDDGNGNGDDNDDGGDDDDDHNVCNQNDADIQLGDNMSQSENHEPGFTVSKLHLSEYEPLCTVGDDLANTARESDIKSLLDCETNQDRPEKVLSDEITSNQSPFLMTLRSGRKRKRERLSTKVATDQLNTSTEHGDIPNNRKLAKTENITEQRSFENLETKKSRNDSDNDVVDHVINCTETKSSETNLTDSCSSFREHSLSKASESLATPSKITEELRQEVSACLKSITDGVVVRESAVKDRAVSFVNETNMHTEKTTDHSETSHTEAMNEVSNCLNNVIEIVANSLDAPKSPLGNILRDVKMNEETVVCESSEVYLEETSATNIVETIKCMDLGVFDTTNTTLDKNSEETVGSSSLVCDLRRDDNSMDQSETSKVVEITKCVDLGVIDAMNTTLDRNIEETVGSSLVGDLRRDDNSMDQSETITDSVQMGRETTKKSDSDPSCNSEESLARIGQEFSANDTLEKPLVIPEDDVTESCANESSTFSPVVSAPLSPIPDSPERTREIPSFELWDNLPPLSPIPPSPKELALAWNHEITDDDNQAIKLEKPDVSQPKEIANLLPVNPEVHLIPTLPSDPVSNNLHKCVESSLNVTVDSTDRGNRETSSRTESNDKKTPLVSTDPLDRSSEVSEHKYVFRLLTMLKNNEITTEEVTRRFLIIANLRAATPFASALLHILKGAQDDEEHALMEKFAERHERGQTCEKVLQPIITDFEMRVAVVVHNLSKRKQFLGLLRCLQKLLGNALCGLFRSEDNDSAVLAICRVYTVVCRLMRDIGRIRVFCYDIIKENRRHLLTQKIIESVGLAWPGVLGKNDNSLKVFSDSVVLNGPPYQPLLSTLQVVIMAREALYDKTLAGTKPSRLVFQRLYGWAELPSGIATLEWLARDLVRTLSRDSSYMTLEMKPDFGPSMGSGAFESVKSLELLAVVLGWEWTNDVLIRELLWPVLLEWWERNICRGDGVKETSTGLHVSRCPKKCEMGSQKNEVGVCHTELEVTEVENNNESSAVIKNINSGLNVQNDIKITDNRQMIEAEAASGVSHANKVTLNGVQTELKAISHSGPEICSQVPTTNDVDTDLKSSKTEEENTKAKSVSGCLSEVELKTASEMFTNVNGESSNGLLNKDDTSRVVNEYSKIGERVESESMEVRGAKGEHGLNVEKNNMEVTIVSILRLLGLLGYVGLQKDGVDLGAMINLMCSILTCAVEFEGVTFGIQLAAAYALIDMLTAKPMEIFKVLNNWITQVEDKTKEINLPPHFTRQIKYYRTHLFTKKS